MLKNHRVASRALGLATLTGVALASATAAMAATPAPEGAAPGALSAVPDALSAVTAASSVSPHDVTGGLDYVRLYPLAGGPLDLLSNNLKVPVGGTEVSTFPITAPFRDGLPVREVPAVKAILP